MALTLVEAAKLSRSELQRGVIETFILESRILDVIPFKPIEGNSYQYNEEATLPGVEFRAVNSAYSESTGTVNQKSEGLVILGGDADVDTFIIQTRGNVNDQRAEQDRMKIKAATIKYQDAFFNGDVAVDANSFDGLKKRLTGTQVLDAPATAGIKVKGTSSAERQDFFDFLDELLALLNGPADALFMNKAIRAKLKSAARREGYWAASRDEFGRLIETYNDIAIIDPGKTAAGTDIIPLNETFGTAGATTTSVYAVRYGQDETDQAVTGLTNGGVQVRDLGEIDAKPVKRTRIEFFTGLAVFGSQGAARARGVLNA